MMINRFILRDNTDSQFDDLIVFNKNVDYQDIEDVVIKCMEDKPCEYTNEDIYEYVDKFCKENDIEYTIDYIGHLPIIEY